MIIAVVCVAIIAALAWTFLKPKQQQPQYITETVSRGDLENTVLATGTLDATRLISVGAQVSGQVKKCMCNWEMKSNKGNSLLRSTRPLRKIV